MGDSTSFAYDIAVAQCVYVHLFDGTDKAATGQLPLSVYRKMTINQKRKRKISIKHTCLETIGVRK